MAAQETFRSRTAALNIGESASRDPLQLHWSAIFAGAFVSLLVYFTLMSLGLAFGAGTVQDMFRTDESFNGIAIGAGVWTVASLLISLFLGSYASGRVSGIIATRIGYTQGAVITALFFAVMIWQLGSAVGAAGMVSRNLARISTSAIGATLNQVQRSPPVLAIVEDALGATPLKSPPDVVVAGLAQRLIRGDTASAKTYLIAQTDMTQSEAQAKIDSLSMTFKAKVTELGEKTAQAASAMGWAAFVAFFLGTIAAILGGGTGAMVNLRKPLDRVDEKALRRIPAYT